MTPELKKWLLASLLPIVGGCWYGLSWAVDYKIQQTISPQLQQLRQDVKIDARQERIRFLQMKKNANIITPEEKIELEYYLSLPH